MGSGLCSLLYSPQSGNTALNTNHSHGTRQVLDVTTCKPNDVLDGLLALTARENGVVVPHTKTRLQPPDNIGEERILLAGLIMSGTIPVPNAIKKLLHCETVRVQEPATQSGHHEAGINPDMVPVKLVSRTEQEQEQRGEKHQLDPDDSDHTVTAMASDKGTSEDKGTVEEEVEDEGTAANDKEFTLPSSGTPSSSSPPPPPPPPPPSSLSSSMIEKPLSSHMLFSQSKHDGVKTQVGT